MLSRRNVRTKVMQVLYAMNSAKPEQMLERSAMRSYNRMVETSYRLYVYNLLAFVRIAEHAREDEQRRHSKLRPSQADLNFSAIFANNKYLSSISKNYEFNVKVTKSELEDCLDADFIRKLYTEFAEKEEYQTFIDLAAPEKQDFVTVYLSLYKFLINHETFISMLEDQFPLWSVDKSLIVGAMKKTIKAFPVEEDFLENYLPQHETVRDFGEELLKKVLGANAKLLEIITPSLKNWDADRVAVLDMIILKMALTEFLYFPSIPTKVTLNEFVDMSKSYSTDKSKDFINGILDRLLKNLTKDGMINKEGRGLQG